MQEGRLRGCWARRFTRVFDTALLCPNYVKQNVVDLLRVHLAHAQLRTSSKPWIRRWGEISNFAFRAPSGRDSSWNRINLNPWISERGCLLTQPPFSQNQWSVYVNFARHSSTVLFFELSTGSTTTTGPGTWPMGYISPREEGAGERTCRPRSGSRPSRFYGSTPRTR